jgi:hypothetical protein
VIFQVSYSSFHLLDDHLPCIHLEFKLVLERSLRGLDEGEVRPHLVQQGLQSLQVGTCSFRVWPPLRITDLKKLPTLQGKGDLTDWRCTFRDFDPHSSRSLPRPSLIASFVRIIGQSHRPVSPPSSTNRPMPLVINRVSDHCRKRFIHTGRNVKDEIRASAVLPSASLRRNVSGRLGATSSTSTESPSGL